LGNVDAAERGRRASRSRGQKFIVPCPAIALQREVIPAAGIVEIAMRKCFEARLDCAKEGSYWVVFLLRMKNYARMPSQDADILLQS
jgi:hypothetical protein